MSPSPPSAVEGGQPATRTGDSRLSQLPPAPCGVASAGGPPTALVKSGSLAPHWVQYRWPGRVACPQGADDMRTPPTMMTVTVMVMVMPNTWWPRTQPRARLEIQANTSDKSMINSHILTNKGKKSKIKENNIFIFTFFGIFLFVKE